MATEVRGVVSRRKGEPVTVETVLVPDPGPGEAVVDVQRTGGLNTSQRRFINDLKIPERLGHLLSGFTSPANIRLT